MSTWFAIAFALLAAIPSSYAKQPNEVTYPSLEPIVVNMGPSCRVKLLIPEKSRYASNYIGYTDKGNKNQGWTEGGLGFHISNLPYWSDDWHVGFTCYHVNSGPAKNDTVAFDAKTQTWIQNPDASGIIPEQNLKVYSIKTPNAQGWAYTDDDVAVDAAEKRLQYCVYHGDKAICGETVVGNVKTIRRHPAANRTSYVLKILNSIEFLEDAPPQ